MVESGRPQWLRTILLGITYLVVGIVFGLLANQAASNQLRVRWRFAAWVISAVVFAVNIAYERLRLRCSPGATALHSSLAVGLGAFTLALAAIVHAGATAHYEHIRALVLALVVWPPLTALPAFVVAFVAAKVIRPSATEQRPG